jgi:hypothetical protein
MADVSVNANLHMDEQRDWGLAALSGVDLTNKRYSSLVAGQAREIPFDTDEGTSLTFLYILGMLSSDQTTGVAFKYGFSDADGADPENGTSWVLCSGMVVRFDTIALSTANKLWVYNHGANAIDLVIAAAM